MAAVGGSAASGGSSAVSRGTGTLLGMPLLLINMGGEMLYILA